MAGTGFVASVTRMTTSQRIEYDCFPLLFDDMIRIASLLVLLLHSLSSDAEVSGDSPLRWRQDVIGWHYNPQNKPDWLDDAAALAFIQRAAAGWGACGIELRYLGETEQLPGVMDGANVVGWARDGKRYSAWTSWRARRNGAALEADITLYANVFDTYRQRGIDPRLELYKSLVHEFGHVLGLGHSATPGDAMSVGVRTRAEWVLPSENDLERCRERYPGR